VYHVYLEHLANRVNVAKETSKTLELSQQEHVMKENKLLKECNTTKLENAILKEKVCGEISK